MPSPPDPDAVLRSLRDDDTPFETPPESIWDGIAAEIGENVTPMAARPGRRSVRPPRWLPVAAAAALVLVVGVAFAVSRDGGTSVDDGSLVASADLALLTSGESVGSAELVEVGDSLQVDVVMPAGMAPADGYYEAWLIDDELTEPVSLGPVTPGANTFTIPVGIDPAAYPVVDVSVEQDDGDESHSGASVIRGTLTV